MAVHKISPELLTLDRVDEILKKGLKIELSEESKSRIYLIIGDYSYIFFTILNIAWSVDMNILNPAWIAYIAISNRDVITPTTEETKLEIFDDFLPSSSSPPVNMPNIPDIASAIELNSVAIIA